VLVESFFSLRCRQTTTLLNCLRVRIGGVMGRWQKRHSRWVATRSRGSRWWVNKMNDAGFWTRCGNMVDFSACPSTGIHRVTSTKRPTHWTTRNPLSPEYRRQNYYKISDSLESRAALGYLVPTYITHATIGFIMTCRYSCKFRRVLCSCIDPIIDPVLRRKYNIGHRRVHQTRCDPGKVYRRNSGGIGGRCKGVASSARFAVHHTEFANGQIAPAIALAHIV